ncbi:putative phenylalanine--tRNA ligase [Helianthus annuus]|nr:putative phenylalanine--tRNA ligase [Helianthus annuus]
MEGVRMFSPNDWNDSGKDGTSYAADDLKACLEGLARHLFGQLGIKFKPFSKYPPCYKDMSFWINDSFTENNLCEIVRGVASDLAEEVQLIDNFTNKKAMTSHCYRITYRSMERSLTDEEINELQWNVRDQVQRQMNVELR